MRENLRTSLPSQAAPATRAYDVCVIGSQLAGVLTAALLARRGLQVLHVDTDGRGTGYVDGGWRIPWGPSIVPSPKVIPAAEAALSELGLVADVAHHLAACHPPLQVLLPRHRLDLAETPAARGAELLREWPDDGAALSTAFEELRSSFDSGQTMLEARPPLPPRGPGEVLRLRRSRGLSSAGLRQSPFAEIAGHPLATVLRGAWPFLSSLDGEPSPFGLTRTLGAALQGTLSAPGGDASIAARVRPRIAEHGGELLGAEGRPEPIARFEWSGGKVDAIQLESDGRRCSARAFVLAGDLPGLAPLLGDEGRLGRWIAPAVRAGKVVSRAWVVRDGALPAPLGGLALASPGADGGPVLLQALPAVRAASAGPASTVGARVLVAGAAARTGSEPEALARIQAAVREYFPFLDRATLHESTPPDGGAPHHPLFAPHPYRVLGVGGVATRSPAGNLFLSGREVLPGLGLEGQFHAAWQAAAAVERQLGIRRRAK